MLITLMFSVVAKKSRTLSSLPCSANEQVCRRCEGERPGSQPKLASGNIPHHRRCAQCMNGGWPRSRDLPLFHEFKSSLVEKFELLQEFSLSRAFHEIREFQIPRLLLRDWVRTGHWAVSRTALCAACFAYSVVVVVVVFPLLFY